MTDEELSATLDRLSTATDAEEDDILQPILLAAMAELDAGGGRSFDSIDELMAYLESDEE